MIIKLEYDAKTYIKEFLLASLSSKPALDVVWIILLGIIIYIGYGLIGIFTYIAALILLPAFAFFLLYVTLFLPYKNKNGKIPVTYHLETDGLKVIQGDDESKHVHTTQIMRKSVKRVWTRKDTVLMKSKFMVYSMQFDDKLDEFVAELQRTNWPVNTKRQIGEVMSTGLTYISIGALTICAVFIFIPDPLQTENQNSSSSPDQISTTPEEIVEEVNSQREQNGVSVLALDNNLVTTAQHACADMMAHKYSDSKNPETGGYGYDYIYEYYPESEVGEVLQAVSNQDAKRIIKNWIANPQTKDMILGRSYQKLGVAICEYTVDRQYDKNIILHLAS